ncbi:hypothetical protein [Chishuiella changwenlii]|uniref:hypothetical protein n=1 Tax=Chishuiella changwenlii TaxID=1434701 RepID=UPI002FDAF2D5
MNYKIIILQIIKNNKELGLHKFDRLFHEKIEFSISWLPIMSELRNDGLIENNDYKITPKGLEYLSEHLKE